MAKIKSITILKMLKRLQTTIHGVSTTELHLQYQVSRRTISRYLRDIKAAGYQVTNETTANNKIGRWKVFQ